MCNDLNVKNLAAFTLKVQHSNPSLISCMCDWVPASRCSPFSFLKKKQTKKEKYYEKVYSFGGGSGLGV